MIPAKAEELGRLIGQTEEYKALKRARDRLRETPGLAERLRRLEEIARGLESAAAQGQEAPAADMSAYDSLLGEIQGDAAYQGMIAAQSNFDKLMLRVNEHILNGIQKGAASSIITLS
ncbi:MAG TPA: YlbF family regulator [Gemmatimonadales bacterium]|nr:YlbF family regulator [Gemmatimonadales bacterium]